MNLCMASKHLCLLLPLLLCLHSEARDAQTCAATISELKEAIGDPIFPLTWKETTMSDGKPLVVSIGEKNGSLSLEFIKTSEGLWAEGAGAICKAGADLEIRFSAGQMRLGPAANWVMRISLGQGGKFTLTKLGPEQLKIATSGWSGIFSPTSK
jgi:hypothetical protein